MKKTRREGKEREEELAEEEERRVAKEETRSRPSDGVQPGGGGEGEGEGWRSRIKRAQVN